MMNTLKDLELIRNKQINEGVCEGSMYVGGNYKHGARHEKCAHREECDLYREYLKLEWTYDVKNHMRRLTPRVWRKCEPYKKGE